MAKVEYANVLLWNVDEVKSESFLEFSFSDISRLLFSTYKLWPTFIGTALTNDRKEVGRLPVLLWSVQESYLAQNRRQSQEIEGVGARGQKRKRREISEDEETETNEGGPVSVKKGKVSYWSDLWSHVRSVFGGFAMSDIPPQPVIEQRSKETSPESSRDLHKEDPGRNRIRIVEKGEEPDVSLIRQMVSSPPPPPPFYSPFIPLDRSLKISCPQLASDLCGRKRMTQKIALAWSVILSALVMSTEETTLSTPLMIPQQAMPWPLSMSSRLQPYALLSLSFSLLTLCPLLFASSDLSEGAVGIQSSSESGLPLLLTIP
jgi:hypothetical protein